MITVHKAWEVLGNGLLEPSDCGMRKAETGVKGSVSAEQKPGAAKHSGADVPCDTSAHKCLQALRGFWGRWRLRGECFRPELMRARHPHRIRVVGVVAAEE